MARKKSHQENDLGPYSPEQTLSVIAGCPFTGFGPCTSEKCTFFIATGPKMTNRECMFKLSYMNTVIHRVYLEAGILKDASRAPDNLRLPGFVQRAAESIALSLDYLEGLASHPKTEAWLAEALNKARRELADRVKEFVEQKPPVYPSRSCQEKVEDKSP